MRSLSRGAQLYNDGKRVIMSELMDLIEMNGWVIDHRVHHHVVTYHDITTWEGPPPHLTANMVGRVFDDPLPVRANLTSGRMH